MKEHAVSQDIKEFMLNTMLRSWRNQIEYAFGRFKALKTLTMDVRLEDFSDTVLAYFVLHNFCEERNTEPLLVSLYAYNTKEGGVIRDAVTKYFAEHL